MSDRLLARKTTHNQVLLVDDDPTILRLLSTWLDVAGYAVLQANNGEEALALIEHECPDFLLTDWEMPHIDGLTLCRTVRDMHLPHYMYVVFLTSRTSRDDTIGALDAGADDILSKPVQRSELLARMLAGGRVLDLERQLSLLAKSDVLTGLYTRRTFFEFFEKEWDRACRHELPLSCVMFDIDFFKRINDQHGHPVGDVCLQAIARMLTENCRSSDVVCRFAGDEFLALLPETDQEQAVVWAERLRSKIADHRLNIGEVSIQMTATFGVAQRAEATHSTKELLDQADQALLIAKHAGRDRVLPLEPQLLGRPGSEETKPESDVFLNATAQDVMRPCNAPLPSETPAYDAVEILLRLRFPAATVVDKHGKLCGVLSENDLAEIAAHPDRWSSPIGELMTKNLVAFDQNEPASDIYEYLSRGSVSQVIVVQDDFPVGYVGMASLMRWVDRNRPGGSGNETAPSESSPLDDLTGRLLDETQQLRSEFQIGGQSGSAESVPDAAARIQSLAMDLFDVCCHPQPACQAVGKNGR